MDKGVVEGCVDVRDAEDNLALSNLGTELHLLLLRDLGLLWGLSSKRASTNPSQNKRPRTPRIISMRFKAYLDDLQLDNTPFCLNLRTEVLDGRRFDGRRCKRDF